VQRDSDSRRQRRRQHQGLALKVVGERTEPCICPEAGRQEPVTAEAFKVRATSGFERVI
jgi:hypothetical protein